MILGAVPLEKEDVFGEYDPSEYYVICADGGYETALRLEIQPDLVVGDFDSAKKKPPKEWASLTLPVEKDVTDTMYAVIKGLSKGFRSFLLLGCLGGSRFDHSLANLEVLQYISEHGGQGVLADRTTKVFLISDSRLCITELVGATVSVFPYNGSSCTVSYKGLKYPLNHAQLKCGGLVMGVSNQVTEERAEILVHSGTVLVVVYQP